MHYLCALSVTRPFEVARDNLLAFVGKATGSSSDGVGSFGGGGPGGGGTLGGVGITSNLRGGVPAPKSLLVPRRWRRAAQAKMQPKQSVLGSPFSLRAPRRRRMASRPPSPTQRAQRAERRGLLAGRPGRTVRIRPRRVWTSTWIGWGASLVLAVPRAEKRTTLRGQASAAPCPAVADLRRLCGAPPYRRGGGDGRATATSWTTALLLRWTPARSIFALHSRLPPTQARSDSQRALMMWLRSAGRPRRRRFIHSGEGAAAMPARTVPPDGALRGAAAAAPVPVPGPLWATAVVSCYRERVNAQGASSRRPSSSRVRSSRYVLGAEGTSSA